MQLLSLLLAISAFPFSLGNANITTTDSKSVLLNFDDIETINGFAKVPANYSYLAFSSLDVFTPKDLNLLGMVTDNDLNCAVSSPNALIGSRSNGEGSKPASISIANATAMIKDGLHPFFTLLSFQIKPMESPPPGTAVYVKGYSIAHQLPLRWNVEFSYDYHLPFLVKLQDYSEKSWEKLHKVEIYADFGEYATDWEFAIDDLEVQFVRNSDGHDHFSEQVILG